MCYLLGAIQETKGEVVHAANKGAIRSRLLDNAYW